MLIKKITIDQYLEFANDYWKSVRSKSTHERFGQAFLNKFGGAEAADAALFYETDPREAEVVIVNNYVVSAQ